MYITTDLTLSMYRKHNMNSAGHIKIYRLDIVVVYSSRISNNVFFKLQICFIFLFYVFENVNDSYE